MYSVMPHPFDNYFPSHTCQYFKILYHSDKYHREILSIPRPMILNLNIKFRWKIFITWFLKLPKAVKVAQKFLSQWPLSAEYSHFQLGSDSHSHKYLYEFWFYCMHNFVHFPVKEKGKWHKNCYQNAPVRENIPIFNWNLISIDKNRYEI